MEAKRLQKCSIPPLYLPGASLESEGRKGKGGRRERENEGRKEGRKEGERERKKEKEKENRGRKEGRKEKTICR
jgi:hypothetical protein